MVSLIETIDAAAAAQKQRNGVIAAASSSSSPSSSSSAAKNSGASSGGSGLTASGKPKEKRRNNEKRKEKSRDAARCRRSKETEIFMELSQVLPLKTDDVSQLDKASVMRITIAYLKIRDMFQLMSKARDCNDLIKQDADSNNGDEKIKPKLEINDEEWLKCREASQLLKQTIDGFLLVLSNEGDITYVTENIVDYLGIAKIDALGQQIWEYTHQCDHAEIKEALNLKRNGIADKIKDEHLLESGITTHHRDLFVRMKCTLTSRGRSINIKSASYKVIHITGHLTVNAKGERLLVAIGRPIPHPSNIEIPLGTSTFLTKHSLDMKFTYVDDKMLGLLGYKPNDLLDTSLFGCQHGADSERLMATFKSVLSKGQGETCRYRFLGKYGGYCWIVTQATVVLDKLKPQSVVCVNYVISNLENKHEIYSLAQQTAASENIKESSETEANNNSSTTTNNNNNSNSSTNPETTTIITAKLNENQIIHETTKTTTTTIIDIEDKTKLIDTKEIIEETNKPTTTSTIATATIDDIKQQQQLPAELLLIKRENHSPGPRTITSQIISNNNNSTNLLRLEEKRPKSVTASVFRNTAATPTPIPIPTPTSTTTLATSATLPVNLRKTTFNVAAAVVAAAAEQTLPPTTTTTAAILSSSNQSLQNLHQQQQQQQQQQTQDMNKGFLSFADDGRGLTMLKEEPDDLSHHLAATACIQLDDTPFGDMLVGLMGTCLLPDDINSLDSTTCSTTASGQHYQSNNNNNTSSSNSPNNNSPSGSYTSNNSPLSPHTAARATAGVGSGSNTNSNPGSSPNSNSHQQQHQQQQHHHQQSQQQQQHHHHDNSNSSSNIDPLFNYREESNDTNCSQHLHSPSITSKSPEDSSLPSLCSPNSLTQEDDFSFVDFGMRAPYIPMGDDMPLLTETDLMWCPPEDLQTMVPKDIDAMQQQLQSIQQQQQQQQYSNNTYQQQQQTATTLQQQQQQHQHFSNSLCSSPASTVSSLSPSPMQQQQHHHQQQQQQSNVFASDTSELAALLCGTGNGTLSILSNGNGANDDDCVSEQRLQQLQQELQLQEQQQQQQQHQQQLQQQQQQQQQLLSLSIECKKEKYEVTMAPSLCHSIEDAFENDYSKDSTTLDWSELLQMHVADATTSSSPAISPLPMAANKVATIQLLQQHQQQLLLQQQQQQQQQQQNIILNSVPLITIQNNKAMLQQQDQLHELIMPTGKQPAMKLLNGTTIAPVTTKATIRLVESKAPIPTHGRTTTILQTVMPQQQQQQQSHGNKRHLNTQTSSGNPIESKRLKSGNVSLEVQSPQLLQQLIGKDSSQQQTQASKRTSGDRWSTSATVVASAAAAAAATTESKQLQMQKQQQQSNSVLKNLLVNAAENVVEPMQIDDESMDQSEARDFTTPLQCHTTTETMLRNYRHNPLISGSNLQLSPVLSGSDAGGSVCDTGDTGSVVSLDDSMPPGLTPCDSDASSSDSGIDENSLTENRGTAASPSKQKVIRACELIESTALPSSETPSNEEETVKSQETVEPCGSIASSHSRKTSISYLYGSNPLLCDQDWRDLCNDDYNMSGEGFEFNDHQLDQVLGLSEDIAQ